MTGPLLYYHKSRNLKRCAALIGQKESWVILLLTQKESKPKSIPENLLKTTSMGLKAIRISNEIALHYQKVEESENDETWKN